MHLVTHCSCFLASAPCFSAECLAPHMESLRVPFQVSAEDGAATHSTAAARHRTNFFIDHSFVNRDPRILHQAVDSRCRVNFSRDVPIPPSACVHSVSSCSAATRTCLTP